MRSTLFTLIVLGFTFAAAAQIPAVASADPKLDQLIKTEISNFKGKVWIYAKNLDTGKEYSLRGDEQVRTASTIKLPIMTEVFRQVAEGKIAWTDEFTIEAGKIAGGSGILKEFTPGHKIDLKTATVLMIVLSDNTATNLILDKVSSNSVNEFMAKLGLNDTLSLRKIGGGGDAKAWDEPLNKLFGIGRSSPKDMVRLLEMLENGQVVSKEASAEMIAILRRQQYKDGIGRNVLDTIPVASKSGALDRLRSDVGIVYTRRGRIAIAITVDDMHVVHYTTDDIGSLLIWRLSQILQEGLAK
ncbi:serine hydrolase [Leptolyngbya sp. 7M]|uniref:serine hydrolase n=1 Tax=Leptolyngbya sp. 7M TaxID=2812896 RepID=UPI001B8B02CA|nr:serine hydrolase [Leptolyngbya sp. 7M]QYO66640.1 class A beta-lactamase-related serine hydrolase [Leptolyngbya sp. 7M]